MASACSGVGTTGGRGGAGLCPERRACSKARKRPFAAIARRIAGLTPIASRVSAAVAGRPSDSR